MDEPSPTPPNIGSPLGPTYPCPSCGEAIQISIGEVGQRRPCPKCNVISVVPMPRVGIGRNARVGLSKQKPKEAAASAAVFQNPTQPAVSTSTDAAPEAPARRSLITLFCLAAGLAVGCVGYYGFAWYIYTREPVNNHYATAFSEGEVIGQLELVVRRWQSARRSREEVETLQVTLNDFKANNLVAMVPDVQLAIDRHEKNIAEDGQHVADVMSDLAIFRDLYPQDFERLLKMKTEDARTISRVEAVKIYESMRTHFDKIPEDPAAYRAHFLAAWNNHVNAKP